MKYKFFRKDFLIDRRCIYLLPTVIIGKDYPMYLQRTLAVQFHWLCFNARLMWEKEGAE